MPGRVLTRTSTASQISRKASVLTLNARTSIEIPDEGPSTALRANISNIFADAQKTTASHRKLVVSLRKIHEACCYEPTKPAKPAKPGLDRFGEDDFNVEVARCLVRIVTVKKSESVGDRLVRFIGLFLRHASEKGV